MMCKLGTRVRLKKYYRIQAHWKKNRERVGTIVRLIADIGPSDGWCEVLWDGKRSLDQYYLHELELVRE